MGGGLIPTLTLGIPGSGVLAIILGAFSLTGLTPGPRLFIEHADTVYSIILGLFIANLFFTLYGLTIVKLIGNLIKVDINILIPIIISLSVIGALAAGFGRMSYVLIAFILGIFCYFLRKFNFSMPAIIIGIVLGPMAEANLHRSLKLSGGNWSIFFTRPITIILIILILFGLFSRLKIMVSKK